MKRVLIIFGVVISLGGIFLLSTTNGSDYSKEVSNLRSNAPLRDNTINLSRYPHIIQKIELSRDAGTIELVSTSELKTSTLNNSSPTKCFPEMQIHELALKYNNRYFPIGEFGIPQKTTNGWPKLTFENEDSILGDYILEPLVVFGSNIVGIINLSEDTYRMNYRYKELASLDCQSYAVGVHIYRIEKGTNNIISHETLPFWRSSIVDSSAGNPNIQTVEQMGKWIYLKYKNSDKVYEWGCSPVGCG